MDAIIQQEIHVQFASLLHQRLAQRAAALKMLLEKVKNAELKKLEEKKMFDTIYDLFDLTQSKYEQLFQSWISMSL